MNPQSEGILISHKDQDAVLLSGRELLVRVLVSLALILIVLAGIITVMVPDPRYGWHLSLTRIQDRDVGIFFAVAFLSVLLAIHNRLAARCVPSAPAPMTGLAAFAVFAATGACAVWLLHGFDFSADEFLLVQEAKVFASGHLAAPIPVEWRPYINAIQPLYVRVSEDRSLLTTAYFPGSAALYALFEVIRMGPLLNPTLAAGSVLLTAHIARRIFPDAKEVAVLAAVLLACSPQFLVAAMTPYAMTAHLFLNLAWLAFFIRDTRLAHVGAIAVGVAAIWQHQIHVHLLFALPFLADLAFRRRAWRLFATYLLVYGLALAGCMSWRAFVLDGPAINFAAARVEAGGVDYLVKRIITDIISVRSVLEPLYWMASQLRFATWQTPLMLVLAACGLLTVRRAPHVIRLLTIGLPLALLPSFLLVIEQGVGWGFRYIHVHLGSLSLLAAWAVVELKRRTPELQQWRRIAGGLMAVGLVTAPALIIWRLVDFTSVVLPYRAVETVLEQFDTDVLITGHYVLVRNDFAFLNTPKVLWFPALSDDQLSELCSRWNVAPVPREILARISIGGTSAELKSGYAIADHERALARLEAARCQ